MSESNGNLQAQLEAATTSSAGGNLSHGAATRELREGWLALGQSLGVQDRAWDEAALVAKLIAVLPPEVARPVVSPRSELVAASPQAWFVTSALAATLVLCAAAALYRVSLPSEANRVPARSLPLAARGDADAALAAPVLAWSDPLDEQIARAELRLEAFRPGWHDLEGSFSALDEQLGVLARDLDGGSL